MEIAIRMKTAGKKRPQLDRQAYFVEDGFKTLGEFIAAIVEKEVRKYNEKVTDQVMVDFLSEQEVQEQADCGKVGFGTVYSERKADGGKARQAALEAVADGLVRIYLEKKDQPDCAAQELVGLGESVDIQDGDTVTFIRFSFLSGRLW